MRGAIPSPGGLRVHGPERRDLGRHERIAGETGNLVQRQYENPNQTPRDDLPKSG